MIPDLGRYAFEVLAAWGISLGLLAVLVGLSFRRAARAKAALDRIEGGRDGH